MCWVRAGTKPGASFNVRLGPELELGLGLGLVLGLVLRLMLGLG